MLRRALNQTGTCLVAIGGDPASLGEAWVSVPFAPMTDPPEIGPLPDLDMGARNEIALDLAPVAFKADGDALIDSVAFEPPDPGCDLRWWMEGAILRAASGGAWSGEASAVVTASDGSAQAESAIRLTVHPSAEATNRTVGWARRVRREERDRGDVCRRGRPRGRERRGRPRRFNRPERVR